MSDSPSVRPGETPTAPRDVKLWTVTMLENAEHSARGPVAICTTQAIACEIVESNEYDIHETNHEYAVIAVVAADIAYGLFPEGADEEIWYRWNGTADDGDYVRCEKPAQLQHIHFGL